MRIRCSRASIALLLGLSITPEIAGSAPVTATTSDGVEIHGETWFADLDAEAPLILLFHQGGSSARGEYGPLVGWLNENGFRAIGWDLRAGGDRHGVPNRTVEALAADAATEFCDAMPDLEAALAHALSQGLAEQVVVWGSSYTGSLVFGLAARHPEHVAAVIAFSPASGGPMAGCTAENWLDEVRAPVFALRPASEMERESSRQQRAVLEAAGVRFEIVENGVHGSSMLVDERTGHDMRELRDRVSSWLREQTTAR